MYPDGNNDTGAIGIGQFELGTVLRIVFRIFPYVDLFLRISFFCAFCFPAFLIFGDYMHHWAAPVRTASR